MNRQRPATHPTNTTKTAPWMKAVFIGEVALVIIIAVIGWEHWDNASQDFANKTREAHEKNESNRHIEQKNINLEKFLTKFNNDEEFRLRVARQRLGYTQDGEIVLRIEQPVGGRTSTTPRP